MKKIAPLRHGMSGVVPGRVGTRFSDRRFRAPDGSEWDSKFEWQVYDTLVRQGHKIERCSRSDRHTVSYTHRVRSASCAACGSSEVGKHRTYTPDLFYHPPRKADGDTEAADAGYYIECKGYMRSDERGLLRALCAARPDLRLRFIFQRNYPITRKSATTAVDWVKKFLKKEAAVWTGKLPDGWAL